MLRTAQQSEEHAEGVDKNRATEPCVLLEGSKESLPATAMQRRLHEETPVGATPVTQNVVGT